MVVRFICAKYLKGLCKDDDSGACEHRSVHRPSLTCNDPLVICDDGSPAQCIPVLDADTVE